MTLCVGCSGTLSSIDRLSQAYYENETFSVDACFHCNSLWFDRDEDTKISRDSILAILQSIEESKNADSTNLEQKPPVCLRCKQDLIATESYVNDEAIRYHACPDEHGVFMSFEDFMKIKSSFIQKEKPKEISEEDARFNEILGSRVALEAQNDQYRHDMATSAVDVLIGRPSVFGRRPGLIDFLFDAFD